MSAGYVGVTFFFVLSGFVLTYSWDRCAKATRFYRRRFARIYPVHLLFVALAMLPITAPPNWPALPANLLLIQSWFSDDAVVRSFSGVSWSLSCEFFFYATFPLLVRWLPRVRRPLTTLTALVGVALGTGILLQIRSPSLGLLLFHLPAFRIVEFVCGVLAATAFLRGWAPALRVPWAAASVVVSYLAVLCLPALIGYRTEDRWALTLTMVPSFVALITASARADLVGAPSLLRRQTMVSLGEWSFCIYVSHPLVIHFAQPMLASAGVLGSLFGCVLVVAAVVVVSFVLHATFERPLERRLRGRRDERPSGTTETEHSEGPLRQRTGRSVTATS